MSPVFGHGQLRLYLLALLDEGPRHGYEVIRALEERFEGLYSPSAGTVYPRLAKLEEEGLIERTEEEGRKVSYRITDAGRAVVAERTYDLADLQTDLDHSVRELAQQVRQRVRGSTQDLREELRAAAKEARRTARPAGTASGPEAGAGAEEAGPDLRGDIESALHVLRHDLRRATRAWAPDESQREEIVAILTEANQQIRKVLNRQD